VSDKKDSLIPSIKPAQDEVASYRASRRVDAPKQSNFNGMLVFVIVLMAIMMGVGGYTLFEVQENLDQSNRLLEKSQESIRELDQRLALAGSESSSSFLSMKSSIEANLSEIRKLWDVSNKRNRQWIKANEAAIGAQNKTVASADGRVKAMEVNIAEYTRRFGQMTTDMVDVRQTLTDETGEMVAQVAVMRGQVQSQAIEVGANKRNIGVITRQMSETSEAIEGIDKHRGRLAQQLVEMRREIQDLQSADAADAPE
jgi:chromosome segregation ATPase